MDNFIIEEALRRGFGSMNKNDFEVLIFHLLRNLDSNDANSIKGLSSYAISKKLLIPESKVKRLLYESDLRYPPEQEDLKSELMHVLKTVRLLKDEKTIKFAIRKKLLRQYLADELAKDKRFFDFSFNSEIIVISISDLTFLLQKLYREESSQMIKEAKRRANDDKDFPVDIGDILRLVAAKAATCVLGEASERIVDLSFDSITKFINSKK